MPLGSSTSSQPGLSGRRIAAELSKELSFSLTLASVACSSLSAPRASAASVAACARAASAAASASSQRCFLLADLAVASSMSRAYWCALLASASAFSASTTAAGFSFLPPDAADRDGRSYWLCPVAVL